MKKIAIVSYGIMPLPPVKGGAVENLIHFFVQNNQTEKLAELTVFSTYDEKAFQESQMYPNTKFVYLGEHKILNKITGFTNRVSRKLRLPAAFHVYPFLMDVAKIINESDFDCVIVENSIDYVPYLRKKTNVPVVLHVHNDHLQKDYYLANEIYQGTTKFLAVSEYIRNCIQTIDSKADNVAVLRNVVDVDAFTNISPEMREEVRNAYNIAPSDTVFAFFGRITPSKGVKKLVEAFLQLAKKHNNVKLLVVGAKWFSANTENAFVKELRDLSLEVEDRIIFTGYVDYNTIARQYACADAVVVPSTGGEASPLVLLEAMAAGKPLIVSDSGGIPESVDDSCAITVPRGEGFVDGLAEAMDRLVTDKALLENMGNSGKARAQMYDKKQYLSKLMELL